MGRTTFLRAALSAATVAFCAGAAAAGPDVIVGDVYGSSNFGTVSGKAAFSIGTVSCNLGDTPLTWVANSTQHPVISQNLYRLYQGRFQQLGQAWLKHGFCALQGTVCSTCTPGGDCTALFPGCSDPYDSGLNGGQSGLGPKSEVNAFTGAFLYPWVNNGSGSGATFKRLQAATTMLGVAGATYYTSSMYIQPQDATSGNGLNNESYRTCDVVFNAGMNRWEINHTNTTQRTKPALQAWKDADAGVQIVNFDVPGEGRFIVAMKATSLGGGNWHYEYAVQNLNSDRSGQSFVVPLPSGVVASNLGFSDVDYHSGEPYALTDWTGVVTPTQVGWATSTHAVNPNANALRWDTIYNFWFDANAAPAQGGATINLFKPGTPTSVTAAIQVPGGSGGPTEPTNNACAAAANLSAYGTYPFNTAGATTDGPAETLCNGSGTDQVYNDVWFTYTACSTGSHTLSTCGATFDTRIAVYSGNCPGAANTAIACNDDAAACGVNSLQSSVSFAAVSGQTYRIRVGSFYNNTVIGQGYGAGSLVLSGPECGTPGNSCANAIVISGYTTAPFTTVGTTTDGPAETLCNNAGDSQVGSDMWFRWSGCASGPVTLSICDANYDSKIAVYAACPLAPNTAIACNDDACGTGGLASRVTFTAAANTEYLVRIGGYNAATGSGNLIVTGPNCSLVNDSCAGATVISGYSSTAFSNAGATTDGPAETLCTGSGDSQVGSDIWFRWTGCATGTVTINMCDANYDSRVAVYTACPVAPDTAIACNDDACGTGGLASQLSFAATANTPYLIRIGGYNAATGAGTLVISGPACPPPGPLNDNCANRSGVGQGNTVYTTVGATTDGPVHAACDNAGSNQITNDIWFNHPSQCPGSIRIGLCDANFDSKLAIYDDAGCTNYDARLMVCNDDACGTSGLASQVRIPSRIGRNYTIRIGGFNGATGSGNMTITYCPADFDANGTVEVPDIFAFLSAWFAQDVRANIDGNGVIDVPDIFAFLSLWFAGGGACG